jgi:hypothetical protein
MTELLFLTTQTMPGCLQVTHVFVPPGVKFTVLWRDRPLGATITGAPVTGSLVATAGDATRSWGLGWQAVYVQ